MTQAPTELSREGDICTSCLPFWQGKNMPPKELVALRERTDHGVPIVVCPYCDGEPVLRSGQ